jgi:hypothetical protein
MPYRPIFNGYRITRPPWSPEYLQLHRDEKALKEALKAFTAFKG